MKKSLARDALRRHACRLRCLLASAAMAGLVAVSNLAGAVEVQPVAVVDLQRYAGKWYEIARLPNRFQADCVGDVSATYTPQEDGRIQVVNRCRKQDNSIDEAQGVARVVDPSTNAKLEVRFAPAWLSWLPLVWGDYWIIDLTPDYSVAAVGEPKREWLWILARQPKMDDAAYQALLDRLAAQGFDVAQLRKTSHK